MARRTLVLVTRNGLGSVSEADRALGVEMFDKLVHTFESAPEKPWAMAFYTEGVKLAVEGSPMKDIVALMNEADKVVTV
jgi:hypothetical protein